MGNRRSCARLDGRDAPKAIIPAFQLLLAAVLVGLIMTQASAANVIGTIAGFNSPYGISTSPNGVQLYVVNNGNNTVSIVNITGAASVQLYTFNIPLTVSPSNVVSLLIGNGLAVNSANQLYVTGSTPVANTPIFVDSNNAISITQASATSNGFLSSTDWNTFNDKLSSQTYGVNTINALLGAVNVIGENNIYARVSGQNVIIGIPQSSATSNGFLSSTDWITFNTVNARAYAFSNTLPITYSNNVIGCATCLTSAVTTVNGLSGSVNILQGANIVVTTSGQNIIITANTQTFSQVFGVNTLNALLGAVDVMGNNGITTYASGQNVVINLPYASSSNNGILTSTDWNTFNNKLSTALLTAGTGLGTSGTQVYLLPLTPGTGITVTSTNTIALTPLTAGTGITVSSTNAISLTSLSSSGPIVISSTNSIGCPSCLTTATQFVPSISAGTGISVSASNQISLIPLTGTSPIVISSTNDITCPTCLTSQTYGVNSLNNLVGAVNVIGANNIFSYLSGQNVVVSILQSSATSNGFLSSTDWITFNNKLSTAGTGLGTSGTQVYLLPLTPGTGITVTSTNTIALTPLTAGTGITVTSTNNIALTPLSSSGPIVITSTNDITCPTCLTSQIFGVNSLNNLVGAVNVIAGGNDLVTTSGQNVIITALVPPEIYGVNSLNALLGAVNVIGENNIYARVSGQNVIIGIPQSSATSNGFLTSTDWMTFNTVNLRSYAFSNTLPITYLNNVIGCATCLTSAVTTLNGLSGSVNILQGANIVVTTSGQNIIITANTQTFTQVFGVNTLNTLLGAVNVIGNNGITTYTSGQNVVINLPYASNTNNGILTSTDWNTFNNKLSTALLTAGTGLGTSGTQVYLLPLTPGTGITITSTNNIALAQLTGGTGITVTSTNNIALTPLTGTSPIVISSTNDITCPTCVTSGGSGGTTYTAGNGIKISATNAISINAIGLANTIPFSINGGKGFGSSNALTYNSASGTLAINSSPVYIPPEYSSTFHTPPFVISNNIYIWPNPNPMHDGPAMIAIGGQCGIPTGFGSEYGGRYGVSMEYGADISQFGTTTTNCSSDYGGALRIVTGQDNDYEVIFNDNVSNGDQQEILQSVNFANGTDSLSYNLSNDQPAVAALPNGTMTDYNGTIFSTGLTGCYSNIVFQGGIAVGTC